MLHWAQPICLFPGIRLILRQRAALDSTEGCKTLLTRFNGTELELWIPPWMGVVAAGIVTQIFQTAAIGIH